MPSVILSVPVIDAIDGICDVCDNLYSTNSTPRIPTAPRSRIGLAMAMMATEPHARSISVQLYIL